MVCRRVFANHHEVNFTPGPFYMRGWGVYVNGVMLLWTLFEVTILCFPETYPLTWDTFNYAVSGASLRSAASARSQPDPIRPHYFGYAAVDAVLSILLLSACWGAA